jgi:hypothetical protein
VSDFRAIRRRQNSRLEDEEENPGGLARSIARTYLRVKEEDDCMFADDCSEWYDCKSV